VVQLAANGRARWKPLRQTERQLSAVFWGRRADRLQLLLPRLTEQREINQWIKARTWLAERAVIYGVLSGPAWRRWLDWLEEGDGPGASVVMSRVAAEAQTRTKATTDLDEWMLQCSSLALAFVAILQDDQWVSGEWVEV